MECCYDYICVQESAVLCIHKFISTPTQTTYSIISSYMKTKLNNVLLRAMERHPGSVNLFFNCLNVILRSNLIKVCTQ